MLSGFDRYFDWFKLAWIWQMPLMHRAVQEYQKSSLPVKSLYFVEYVSLFHKSVTIFKKSVSIEWKSVTNYGIHIMDGTKYPLYQVILWRHSCIKRVFPDSVIQNIVKFFVRNSHDFVEWTWAIQSEYETLINHSASKPKIQSEWKTTLRSFNNYVDRILPIFKLK